MGSRETFSQMLRKLFSEKGCTQEEFATCIGVSRQAIGKWLSGRGFPRADALDAIADFFGVSVAELVNYEDREALLLRLYNEMNEEGKAKLIERAQELVLLCGEKASHSSTAKEA